MRLKKMRFVYYALMLLPLIVTLIALRFLPDQIPAHYGASGQADRWGSKYESLIIPALNILFGLILLAVAKWSRRQEQSGTNNERVCLVVGGVSLLVFNAMTYYFLYTSFRQVENLSAIPVDLNQLLFGILGVGMILIGNVMPKVRMNSMLGLRTPWSMKDEAAWKKSQRLGGIVFIVGGAAMVAVCFLTAGAACFLWSMGVLLCTAIIGVVCSCWAAAQNE